MNGPESRPERQGRGGKPLCGWLFQRGLSTPALRLLVGSRLVTVGKRKLVGCALTSLDAVGLLWCGPQGDKNSSSSASMARLNIEDAKTPQWLDASCRGLDHSSESHAQLSHELISFWGAACGKFRDVYNNRHTAAQTQK